MITNNPDSEPRELSREFYIDQNGVLQTITAVTRSTKEVHGLYSERSRQWLEYYVLRFNCLWPIRPLSNEQ